MKKLIWGFLILSMVFSSFVTATVINDVVTDDLFPGKEGIIRVEIENILDRDIKDVSLILDFSNLPLTPVGSSQSGVDEIEEDREEDFAFRVRADNNIVPGNYQIPYTLRYDDGDKQERKGSIGITVRGNSEISFSSSLENSIVGEEGKITLKAINRGFGDAKFVSVRIIPEGFTLLSENEVYIGNIDSDDFETASFDVIFNNENAKLIALVTYKDFDNENFERSVSIPLEVRTREEALELGLIKKNNIPVYISILIVLILLWFIYRYIKKRRRLKRSMKAS